MGPFFQASLFSLLPVTAVWHIIRLGPSPQANDEEQGPLLCSFPNISFGEFHYIQAIQHGFPSCGERTVGLRAQTGNLIIIRSSSYIRCYSHLLSERIGFQIKQPDQG